MSVGENPLQALTDDQLWNSQLMLVLVCAKSKSTLRKKHRVVLCNLLDPLTIEANNRGVISPAAPYHASQQRIA